jgi:hypothetical protein
MFYFIGRCSTFWLYSRGFIVELSLFKKTILMISSEEKIFTLVLDLRIVAYIGKLLASFIFSGSSVRGSFEGILH